MTDRSLVLLRHGKSDWSAGASDLHRPLMPRGRRQAAEAGRWLADTMPAPDLAVVSPAQRARSTWDLAAAELASPVSERIDERVYAASATALMDLVRDLPDAVLTAVLVGHNPGLEDLVSALTGRWVTMPTACLAVVVLPGSWSEAGRLHAELTAYGRPPEPER